MAQMKPVIDISRRGTQIGLVKTQSITSKKSTVGRHTEWVELRSRFGCGDELTDEELNKMYSGDYLYGYTE